MTPEPCKGCNHRLNDYMEGQLCRRVNTKIFGIDWPGRPVQSAMTVCRGDLREPRAFLKKLDYWLGL